MLKQTIKVAVAGSASVSLMFMGGIASAHPKNNPNHNNNPGAVAICNSVSNNSTWINNPSVQAAKSGKATVADNKKGGDATSGKAKNGNTTDIGVDNVNKDACPTGDSNVTLDTDKGSGSSSFSLQASYNNNTTAINNASVQSATSGSASVVCNTQGGSAVSGPAVNSNGTTITVTTKNK